ERGKIMGGYAAAVSAGLALGPIVGGLLALYSWRYAFMLTAILSAVVIPICAVYFKSATQPEKAFGTLPKILVSTLRQSNVSLSCAIGLLVFLVAGSTVTFLSDYLGKPPFLVNAAEIGFLLFIGGVASIAVAPVVGFMIGTVGRRKTAVIGGVLTLSAFIVFMIIGKTYWEFFAPLVILFVGQILVFTALGTVVIDSSSHSRGTASSIYNTFRFTGYGLGPALLSPIYIALGFTATLGSFTLLAVVALLLTMRIRTTNATV
ncbi:MAG: MFS transporter, partial [Candidatus Bathyarchaeia archaeon]